MKFLSSNRTDTKKSQEIELPFSGSEIESCLEILQAIADAPELIDEHHRFKSLIKKIHQRGKRAQRDRKRHSIRVADRATIASTEMVRRQNEFVALPQPILKSTSARLGKRTLHKPRNCYVCKVSFSQLHHFYHQLCPTCAAKNWGKRLQTADLTGRIALITGGRIKIGFQSALRLLRDGARVVITTRFAQDAADRFSTESDFGVWGQRLEIHALDLRNIPAVESFAHQIVRDLPSLDILIHNAAQTVKRPLAFYQHLLDKTPTTAIANSSTILIKSDSQPVLLEALSDYRGHLAGVEQYFPKDCFDVDGQQVDRRPNHSWMLKLGEIGTLEMLEVMLVNSAAPFTLTSLLKPLMLRSRHARRFVVNVSAMEGQFGRDTKTVFHPHTNMAKAALNMMTRTSAADFAQQGIYMNAVDTGWITDEKPTPLAERVRDSHGFFPPLDIIDGASRIYDPIATGCNSPAAPMFGHFLKDYEPYAW